MARVRVLFFAALADAAGRRETEVEAPDGEPVARLPARLAERFPKLAPLCANIAYAINAQYVSPDAPLHDGDEVALIPPVSGG